MKAEPWKGQGLAIKDFFEGDLSAEFWTHCSDGESDRVPASMLFRKFSEFPDLEKMAIDLCYGKVIDIGAGAGCHSLELQNRGMQVTAIDISPESVEVMQKRDIIDARLLDYKSIKDEKFDTVLLLMNGIGVVENLENLTDLLFQLKKLVTTTGQIVFDSLDLRDELEIKKDSFDESFLVGNLRRERPKYKGELYYQLEYKSIKYPPFNWLFIDMTLMKKYAECTGWQMEVILYNDDGTYLARLSQ